MANTLSLNNNGKLQFCFIGVGSAFASKNFQTNLLIIKGSNHILVDFGITGKIALETLGIKCTDIEVILPTHSHSDHVGGIETLGLMNYYVGRRFMNKPKLRMVITKEYERALWDSTLRGGMEWNEETADTKKPLWFTDYFDVVRPSWLFCEPRETWAVDVGNIHIELFRTKHIPEGSTSWENSFLSYGIMVDEKILFTADTRFDTDLLKHYEQAQTIFHDVQFFPGAVHAPLVELKTLPAAIKKKMMLVHYADNYDQQDITGFAGWTEQGKIYEF